MSLMPLQHGSWHRTLRIDCAKQQQLKNSILEIFWQIYPTDGRITRHCCSVCRMGQAAVRNIFIMIWQDSSHPNLSIAHCWHITPKGHRGVLLFWMLYLWLRMCKWLFAKGCRVACLACLGCSVSLKLFFLLSLGPVQFTYTLRTKSSSK